MLLFGAKIYLVHFPFAWHKNTLFWPTYTMVSIPDVRREYGLWTAFLAIFVRLFLPTPGRPTRKIQNIMLTLSWIIDATDNLDM